MLISSSESIFVKFPFCPSSIFSFTTPIVACISSTNSLFCKDAPATASSISFRACAAASGAKALILENISILFFNSSASFCEYATPDDVVPVPFIFLIPEAMSEDNEFNNAVALPSPNPASALAFSASVLYGESSSFTRLSTSLSISPCKASISAAIFFSPFRLLLSNASCLCFSKSDIASVSLSISLESELFSIACANISLSHSLCSVTVSS